MCSKIFRSCISRCVFCSATKSFWAVGRIAHLHCQMHPPTRRFRYNIYTVTFPFIDMCFLSYVIINNYFLHLDYIILFLLCFRCPIGYLYICICLCNIFAITILYWRTLRICLYTTLQLIFICKVHEVIGVWKRYVRVHVPVNFICDFHWIMLLKLHLSNTSVSLCVYVFFKVQELSEEFRNAKEESRSYKNRL